MSCTGCFEGSYKCCHTIWVWIEKCCTCCGFLNNEKTPFHWVGHVLARILQCFLFWLTQLCRCCSLICACFSTTSSNCWLILLIIVILAILYFIKVFFYAIITFIIGHIGTANGDYAYICDLLDKFQMVLSICSYIWNIFVPEMGMIRDMVVPLWHQFFQSLCTILGQAELTNLYSGLMINITSLTELWIELMFAFIAAGPVNLDLLSSNVPGVFQVFFSQVTSLEARTTFLYQDIYNGLQPILPNIIDYFDGQSQNVQNQNPPPTRNLLSFENYDQYENHADGYYFESVLNDDDHIDGKKLPKNSEKEKHDELTEMIYNKLKAAYDSGTLHKISKRLNQINPPDEIILNHRTRHNKSVPSIDYDHHRHYIETYQDKMEDFIDRFRDELKVIKSSINKLNNTLHVYWQSDEYFRNYENRGLHINSGRFSRIYNYLIDSIRNFDFTKSPIYLLLTNQDASKTERRYFYTWLEDMNMTWSEYYELAEAKRLSLANEKKDTKRKNSNNNNPFLDFPESNKPLRRKLLQNPPTPTPLPSPKDPLPLCSDLDCFTTDPRNPYCLPPINLSFSFCPDVAASWPFDFDGNLTCDGWIETNCIVCLALIPNAFYTIFIFLWAYPALTFVVLLIFGGVCPCLLPFLIALIFFNFFLGGPDTDTLICAYIHLYDVFIWPGLYYIFWLYCCQVPCFKTGCECIQDCRTLRDEPKEVEEQDNKVDVEKLNKHLKQVSQWSEMNPSFWHYNIDRRAPDFKRPDFWGGIPDGGTPVLRESDDAAEIFLRRTQLDRKRYGEKQPNNMAQNTYDLSRATAQRYMDLQKKKKEEKENKDSDESDSKGIGIRFMDASDDDDDDSYSEENDSDDDDQYDDDDLYISEKKTLLENVNTLKKKRLRRHKKTECHKKGKCSKNVSQERNRKLKSDTYKINEGEDEDEYEDDSLPNQEYSDLVETIFRWTLRLLELHVSLYEIMGTPEDNYIIIHNDENTFNISEQEAMDLMFTTNFPDSGRVKLKPLAIHSDDIENNVSGNSRIGHSIYDINQDEQDEENDPLSGSSSPDDIIKYQLFNLASDLYLLQRRRKK